MNHGARPLSRFDAHICASVHAVSGWCFSVDPGSGISWIAGVAGRLGLLDV